MTISVRCSERLVVIRSRGHWGPHHGRYTGVAGGRGLMEWAQERREEVGDRY